MALTYGFYNSQDGDRKYDAVQMSSIFDGIIEDGIFQSIGTAMAVTASTGKTVVVGVGRAWFDHTWTLNDSGYPIELPESEVLLDRIDAVVLEVDASVGTRANSFKVVEGSPASSPQRPSLIDNETTHQHALAYILRKAGTEEVTQADITNVIGTSETPYVTGPLSIITADAMLAQWQSEFDQWFESLEDTLSGDVAANLANQIMQKVDKTSVVDDLDEIAATTEEGYVAGALAVKDLNSKMIKKEGDSRLVAKAGTESLTYYDSTHLNKIWNVGSEYAGCPIVALMIRRSQTPYANVKSLSCNVIEEDGTAEIVADGSGFVRGHILAVYYMIVGHSQKD